jgi:hypothetical protein
LPLPVVPVTRMSLPLLRDALHDGRQVELADVAHARRDQAQRSLQLAALVEDVHGSAHTPGVRSPGRPELLRELLPMVLGQKLAGVPPCPRGRSRDIPRPAADGRVPEESAECRTSGECRMHRDSLPRRGSYAGPRRS